MKKYLSFIVLLAASFIAAAAGGKTRVWDAPDAVFNPSVNLNKQMKIDRVEFTPDQTSVYLTVSAYPGYSFKFIKGIHLLVDTVKYPVTSVDGLTIGQKTQLPGSGQGQYVFHFPALPRGVKSFDFIETEKNGFNFYGIKERTSSLRSTNWRSTSTGEWLIGLMPDKAVYDSRLWDYITADFDGGKFLITDGNDTISVIAGRERRGERTFIIATSDGSSSRKINASRITGMNLGFYPASQPGVTEFANNGYVPGDSVTISGYLVNMPTDYLKKSSVVAVTTNYSITKPVKFSAPIDSTGFFSLTFPVVNTQSVYFDLGGLGDIPVEPGEKYFFFRDFANSQVLWMGPRSRLLNEMMTYRLDGSLKVQGVNPGRPLATMLKDFKDSHDATVDSIAALHPTLSPLWIAWQKAYISERIAREAGQSRFRNRSRMISPEVREYICKSIVPELRDPITAQNPRMLSTFLRDYTEDAVNRSPLHLVIPVDLKRGTALGQDMSRPTYEQLKGRIDSVRTQISEVSLSGSDSLPAPLLHRAKLLMYELTQADSINGYHSRKQRSLNAVIEAIDSLDVPEAARDIALAKYFIGIIENNMMPLTPEMDTVAKLKLRLPYSREMVKTYNDRFKRLSAIEVAPGSGVMVPADSLVTATTGEELFNRVVEPFRGRLVLIDVWGVGCGPCRQVLKQFPEHRKQLDEYGVVYMFFANSSEDRVWKNVIADYGVEGENVVHYNLPPDKQQMLENYLNINSFPSYRLVNKDGSLVDVNVDLRHRSAIKAIRMLSK